MGPSVSVRVVIDARTRQGDSWSAQSGRVHHALDRARMCPPGAVVILLVAAGRPVPIVDRHDLAHLGAIVVEVADDAATGLAWRDALTGVDPWGA